MQVCHIQQEHSKKEMSLVASHNEELKRSRVQYENELREVFLSLGFVSWLIILRVYCLSR